MVGLLEGLEDWGVKQAVNVALSGLIKDGVIKLADEKTLDEAAIILTNAVLAQIAKKVETPDTSA